MIVLICFYPDLYSLLENAITKHFIPIIIFYSFFLFIFSFLILTSFSVGEYNGKASYYGKSHHGKTMANGKKFNMYALTAAHKTLKFGTKLEVTNVKNDKTVIVEVTDRGPFVPGRILDLSQEAFSRIANVSTGVIKIKYKVLD